LKITPTMMKQASAQKSYEPPLKVAMRCNTLTTRLYGINPASYQEQPPKEHLDEAIPPEPPYFDSPTNQTMVENNVASSPHAFGHMQEESPSSSTNIQWPLPRIYRQSKSIPMATQHGNQKATADLKQCGTTPYDAPAKAQQQ